MSPAAFPSSHSRGQTGTALIVSLIVLLVMTLIGLSAIRGSSLQTLMATHMRDRNLAFESSEAALRDAQAWLNSQFVAAGKPIASATGSSTVWTRNAPATTVGESDFTRWTAADWTARGTAYPLQVGTAIPTVAAQPRVIIEEWQFVPDDIEGSAFALQRGLQNYRITVRGEGGTGGAAVVLQSLLRQRVN